MPVKSKGGNHVALHKGGVLLIKNKINKKKCNYIEIECKLNENEKNCIRLEINYSRKNLPVDNKYYLYL